MTDERRDPLPQRSLERDIGELVGKLSGFADRMTTLEGAMRDGFRQTQEQMERHTAEWRARLTSLEKFRWTIGGIVLATSVLYSVGIVLLGFYLKR